MREDKLKKNAFTLIELLVVIAIVAILAAAIAPMISTTRVDAQVAKILVLIDTLETACRMHYLDTGFHANEIKPPAVRQDLSGDTDPFPGWDEPYINHPLSEDDFPLAESVSVIDWTEGDTFAFDGFDLNGDGTPDRGNSEPGNQLNARYIPLDIAQGIDNILDRGIPGDWRQTGRVEARTESEGEKIYIYLTGTPITMP